MRVLEALNRGLRSCLEGEEGVYLIGEDLLDPYGGAFKVVAGLSTDYPGRVITTPVSEAGIVGVGIGMALRGLRPIVEIMFGDFVTLAADQLINHAAKLRWMSADRVRVPLVVRTPMGGRRGYGPTHSQSLEKLYLGVPGLRVLAPTALGDPSSMLQSAVLHDDDPTLFIEHKLLYALEVEGDRADPEFEYSGDGGRYPTYTISVAGAPRPTVTIATYGYMANLAKHAVRQLAYDHELFAELVVMTQLSPYNPDSVIESLGRTRALVAVEEGTRSHGWGSELIAQASERASGSLSVTRVAARDYPVPASGALEDAVLPTAEDIVQAVRGLST